MFSTDVCQYLYDVSREYPDTFAVIHGDDKITYKDFLSRVYFFRDLFISKNSLKVAICLRSSIDAFASMYGALFAGIEYTPLNISSPLDRLRLIFDRYKPDLIIYDSMSESELDLSLFHSPLFDINDINSSYDSSFFINEIKSSSVYTIFTSGSTGQPKGVIVSRSGLNSYIS